MHPLKAAPAERYLDRLLKLPSHQERLDMFFKMSPKIGQGAGLEISPLFQPLIDKDSFTVDYCDYLPYEELVAREREHPTLTEYGLEVQKLDFVWAPGTRLVDMVPKINGQPKKYDYIVSSHVLEHVPDFLGYIEGMDEVLNEGGVIAFYLPNALGSPEIFRPHSSMGDVLAAYITCADKPSFAKIYDYYRMSVDAGAPFKQGKLGDYSRSHPLNTAVRDGLNSYVNYIDAHCWVFSPESFKEIIVELQGLGIFNYSVEGITETAPTPYGGGYEFCTVLERASSEHANSEAAIHLRNARNASRQQGSANDNFSSTMKLGYETLLQSKDKEIQHGIKAFYEAVAVQQTLKLEIIMLKEMLEIKNEALATRRTLLPFLYCTFARPVVLAGSFMKQKLSGRRV